MGALEEVGLRAPGETPEEVESEAPEEESTIPDGLLKNVLVAATLGAGGIHLWAAWAHSGITRVLIFFTVVATLQLWLAAAIVWVRSIPWSMLIGGAVVNAGVAVVWVLSRTTGVPFQPPSMASMDDIMSKAISNPGVSSGAMSHQESFGFIDSVSSLLEVAVVVAVVVLWLRHRRQGDATTEDPMAPASQEVR
jgi:hypothetical protein